MKNKTMKKKMTWEQLVEHLSKREKIELKMCKMCKFMKRKTRENKSSRKILKDPIRENKSTRNVKIDSLAKINPRENFSP